MSRGAGNTGAWLRSAAARSRRGHGVAPAAFAVLCRVIAEFNTSLLRRLSDPCGFKRRRISGKVKGLRDEIAGRRRSGEGHLMKGARTISLRSAFYLAACSALAVASGP